MPYVTERWLGGTLTNFRTVRSRLKRLEELEALETGGQLETYSKKMQSTLMREKKKIFRNLNGIRTMNRMPEAVIVVDPGKEKNCVREARNVGAKVIALIDTDSDPDVVDLPIPGNDDSIRSIRLILGYLTDSIHHRPGPTSRGTRSSREGRAAADSVDFVTQTPGCGARSASRDPSADREPALMRVVSSLYGSRPRSGGRIPWRCRQGEMEDDGNQRGRSQGAA